MKILEVPIINSDGSIKFTAQVSPNEAQTLLQFAINMSASVGLGAAYNYAKQMEEEDEEDQEDHPIND